MGSLAALPDISGAVGVVNSVLPACRGHARGRRLRLVLVSERRDRSSRVRGDRGSPHAPPAAEGLFEEIGLRMDPLVVDRIVELGASLDEVREARSVDDRTPQRDPSPPNERVAEIRALLAELLEERPATSGPPTMSHGTQQA
jgi:hypothetical protein